MELDAMDALLIAALVVAFPLWSVADFRGFRRKVREGVPDVRVKQYRLVMAVEWLSLVVVAGAWLVRGRDPESLGLGLAPGPGFWIGAGLTLLAAGFLTAQMLVVCRSSRRLRQARRHFAGVEAMIPRGRREASWWAALSVSAGVCEEVVFRGFLITALATWAGTWPAVLLAAAVFGLVHAYQGAGGVGKTAFVGLVTGSLFVLTGSLWAPMLLHAVIDLTSGHIGRCVVEAADGDGTPALAA